jgi:thymidylate kinase
MRRVLRYLDWEAETWKQRASARENESLELRQGLKAYALRHEAQYRDLAAFFKAEWNVSVGEAATAVVRETPEDGADLVQLFDGDGAVDAE